ncbi:MAG: monovalent cation/H+ antiporter subunit A, partial [Amphritea sp.]|nr:monovalent cation/H+ antiporter subunit A [Amphritea sp.]MBQ0784578.1 monovalent cation/H+ antiporter subunit A [Amphritea sp.]
MNLLWVVLLPLIGTLVPLFTERFGRNICTFSVAILPAWSLILVLMFAGDVFDGQDIRQSIDWIPAMGLDLSFRLDGLSLLFLLLILGIGLLVILYARYYLSTKDSMGRFYAYLILFMSAMVGIVISNNLLQLWIFWEL